MFEKIPVIGALTARGRSTTKTSKHLETARNAIRGAGLSEERLLKDAAAVKAVLDGAGEAEKTLHDAGISLDALQSVSEPVLTVLAAKAPRSKSRSEVEKHANDSSSTRGLSRLVDRWDGADDDEAADVLGAVRQRAKDWRDATSVLIALITAALVVSSAKDTVRSFTDSEMRLLLALILVGSAAAALVSLRPPEVGPG